MNYDADLLANEILDYSRNKLLVNLRFMDMALSYHKRGSYKGSIATDGKTLLYDPGFVLRLFKESQEETVRTYLHMILHCVFKHPFIEPSVNRRLWDLSCDMAVESAINDLNLKAVASPREEKQKQIVSELKKKNNILTAEKIYAVLKKADYPNWAIEQWEKEFKSDEHSPWYLWKIDVSVESLNIQQEVDGPGASSSSGNRVGKITDSIEFWGRIAAQMQMDLEVFHKVRGDVAGNMIQNLRSVNRERYDYSSFLRKFAVLGEAMKVNEDEFDYVYYTYGLTQYKDMPLIEPLEYKEVERIKEFIIAIDTSASVSGDEVQLFLQKTYNILMQEDSFFSRINVHIIQCDAKIQEDIVIHNRREFESYLKSMKIRGFGGTDFRPVFNYVDQLIDEGEFRNLKGLLYFTDGYGVFPNKKPPYTTAFIYVQDDYAVPDVPPWAIKLVLQHEEIIEGGVSI